MTPTMHHNVGTLQSLPAMPETAREILSIELASDRGNELLLKLIEKDPAISARIVGLANSPLFGTSRKIMTVGDAATVLGIKRVKMVALGFAMMSSVTRNLPGLLNVRQLWQHSMAVALAMDALSKAMPQEMRPPDEDIYLAGLLHDIGFLVLEYVEPELSNRFHARLLEEGVAMDAEIEAEMLEINHCELGALLAEHWNLTDAIIAVLRHHHKAAETGKTLIAMTNLAEKLLPTFGSNEQKLSGIELCEWQALGIAEDRVEAVEAAMRARAEEIASAFS
ncbi:MAG: HDOD domain-containing protein [Proteobacteria bacterium]|nr:HDOD domain-containing protein [Pseudomonadota bacterium]